MRIADSARKHGIADHDILAAARSPVRDISDQSGGRTLFIGIDTLSRLLEVVVKIDPNDDDAEPEIIHAMKVRPSFLRLLNRR